MRRAGRPERWRARFPDLDLDHPWGIEPEQAVEIARECEAAGRALDARLSNSEGAIAQHASRRARVRQHARLPGGLSQHQPFAELRAAGAVGIRHAARLLVLGGAQRDRPAGRGGRRAARGRALWRGSALDAWARGARRCCSRPRWRAACSGISSARSAAPASIGASFLLDAAGQQVSAPFLQMQERPHLPRALASSPFDAEGVATRDRELVRDGVLDGYVLGSYSARKLGLKTTGNAGGIHNLLVSAPGREP
jgi:PmbA protein